MWCPVHPAFLMLQVFWIMSMDTCCLVPHSSTAKYEYTDWMLLLFWKYMSYLECITGNKRENIGKCESSVTISYDLMLSFRFLFPPSGFCFALYARWFSLCKNDANLFICFSLSCQSFIYYCNYHSSCSGHLDSSIYPSRNEVRHNLVAKLTLPVMLDTSQLQ